MKLILGFLAMGLYHGAFEPLRTLAVKSARRKALKLAPGETVPTVLVDPYLRAACPNGCTRRIGDSARTLVRYVDHAPRADGRIATARMTPMAIDLARFPDFAAFEALVRKRSSRTLPKVRRCERQGYAVHRFPARRHIEDIHAVKTSMPVRAAGPVLAYWFLRPEHLGRQATEPVEAKRRFDCDHHWSAWWGVFAPAPGHRQGGVTLDQRLVAYIRTVRNGHALHYADIMGHRDHLADGVMVQCHLAVVRWLIESGDPAAKGVRVVLYGGAETGRAGLLTWKRRAGFEPTRLMLDPASAGPPPAVADDRLGLRRLKDKLAAMRRPAAVRRRRSAGRPDS